MSTKITVICCVVEFICLILGVLALEFFPFLPVFGVWLVLSAVRRKIYKMLEDEKDGVEDGDE